MSLNNNAAAREAILARVRAARRNGADPALAIAQADAYLLLNPRGPKPEFSPDVVQRFIDWSIKQLSTVDRVSDASQIPTAVARYCDSIQMPRAIVCWPEFATLDWKGAGVKCEARPTVGDDKTGVTGVTAAIAETGTILLTPSATQHTATVLLPDQHIAVVQVSQIVATMEDALMRVKAAHGGGVPRAMNFVSGPSRTADIAQTLVIGAHGPIRVHIIVVG